MPNQVVCDGERNRCYTSGATWRCVFISIIGAKISEASYQHDKQALKKKTAFCMSRLPERADSRSPYCFVLGDNRDNPYDSRHFGTIPLAIIKGRADYLSWPAKDWSRFGRLATD